MDGELFCDQLGIFQVKEIAFVVLFFFWVKIDVGLLHHGSGILVCIVSVFFSYSFEKIIIFENRL